MGTHGLSEGINYQREAEVFSYKVAMKSECFHFFRPGRGYVGVQDSLCAPLAWRLKTPLGWFACSLLRSRKVEWALFLTHTT